MRPRPETPAAARLRRGTEGAFAAAAATLPVAVFWGAAAGDGWLILALLLCGSTIVLAGVTLLVIALARRTAREVAVVLAAILALAGSASLVPIAGTAGREAALDRHAAELEALVAELRAAPPAVTSVLAGRAVTRDPQDEDFRRGMQLLERAHALGFNRVGVEPGYVLFIGSAPFAPDLLYVTDASAPRTAGNCGRTDLRFAGGRWYLYRCLADASD